MWLSQIEKGMLLSDSESEQIGYTENWLLCLLFPQIARQRFLNKSLANSPKVHQNVEIAHIKNQLAIPLFKETNPAGSQFSEFEEIRSLILKFWIPQFNLAFHIAFFGLSS